MLLCALGLVLALQDPATGPVRVACVGASITFGARVVEREHDAKSIQGLCAAGRRTGLHEVVVDDVQAVEAGELLLVRISASHCLWKMVRRLMGSLVQVGAGRLAPRDLARLVTDPATAPGRLS